MSFLPELPFQINTFSLFGIILLLGLLGGELAGRTWFFPRILGYVIVGIIIGPEVLNLVDKASVLNLRAIIDISLGLILFNLGKQLDFIWLRHDKGILLTAIAESGLTFVLIFILLYFTGLPWLSAALIAAIAVTTSPAVTMMVANDLSSEGPVTRRTLILTSLNNLFGLMIFTLLIPISQLENNSVNITLVHICYRFFASVILGMLIFGLAIAVSYIIGKRKETQFIMLVCMVILAISLSRSLNLSNMLTLFVFGVTARNFNYKNRLMEIDFGWLAHLFLIPLFVITGIYLQTKGLWQAPLLIISFIIIRMIAKIGSVFFLANKSNLTKKQALLIGLALTPMAGVAIGMANTLVDFNYELGWWLTLITSAIVTVLEIIGAIATQFAFVKAGEAKPDKK